MPIVGRVFPTISSGAWLVPAQHPLDALLGRQDDRQEVGVAALAEERVHLLLAVRLDVAGSRPVPVLAAQLARRDRARELVEHLGHERPLVDRVVALDVLAQHGRRRVHQRRRARTPAARSASRYDFTVLRTSGAKTFSVHPHGGDPVLRLHVDDVAGDLRRAARSGADADDGRVAVVPDALAELRIRRVLVAPADDLGADLRLVLLEPARAAAR